MSSLLVATIFFYSLDIRDEIQSAWQVRERKTQTLSFEWTAQYVVEKGYHRDPRGDPEAQSVLPPEDLSYATSHALRMAGTQSVRYELEEAAWSEKQAALVNRKYINTFKDGIETRYFVTSERGYPEADISKAAIDGHLNGLPLLAIMYAFRPYSSGAVPTDFEITDESGIIEGRKCLITLHRTRSYRQRFWLDPHDVYVVRRVELSTSPDWHVTTRIDIWYEVDESGVHVPSKWKFHTGRGPKMFVDAVVTNYSLNQPLSPTLFEVPEFDRGTLVRDSRTNDSPMWIELGNGERRIILPHESTLSYAQLLKTETGHGFQPTRRWGFWVSGALFLVVVISLIAINQLRKGHR